MTDTPLISVIIATHNRATLLPRAVRSIYAQTYQHIEVIVIDDASTDETQAVIASLRTEFPSLVTLKNDTNLGNVGTKNLGIRTARGEYIAFLDDDDEYEPGKLEKQLALLLETSEKCASCAMRWVEDGRTVKTTLARSPGISFENGGAISTWLIHRSVFDEVGLLDPAIYMNDDGDFLVRANRKFRFVFVESVEYTHYYSASQISSSRENKILAWSRLLDRYEATFTKRERARAYLKLATFSLIAGKKDIRAALRSLAAHPSASALVILFILLVPSVVASKVILNKALDLMHYPMSFASRYA